MDSSNNKVSNYKDFLALPLDPAVIYGMITRVWGIVSAVVTLPLIIVCFSQELQGYYYTFRSLLGIQTLVELGLGQVIQQLISHEWAKLGRDEQGQIHGDRSALSRLASLSHFALRWYAGVGVVTSLGLLFGGYYFLSHFKTAASPAGFQWQNPWFALSLAAGLNLALSPLVVVLEGCNQINQVYRLKFFQALTDRLATWLVIIAGGGLWAFFAAILASTSLAGTYVLRIYRRFFKHILQAPRNASIIWSAEIWPLQWRFALSWLGGYAYSSLLTPVIFAVNGPVTAGQMGMTWGLVAAIWGFSATIISVRMPGLAMAAARRDFSTMNKVYLRTLLQSTGLLILGGAAILLGLVLLRSFHASISDRFLAPLPTLFLIAAIILQHLRYAGAVYFRVQKRELFWSIALLEAPVALVTFPVFAKIGGPIGLTGAYAVLGLLMGACYLMIFLRHKRS